MNRPSILDILLGLAGLTILLGAIYAIAAPDPAPRPHTETPAAKEYHRLGYVVAHNLGSAARAGGMYAPTQTALNTLAELHARDRSHLSSAQRENYKDGFRAGYLDGYDRKPLPEQ